MTNASAVAEQVLDYYPFGGIRLNEKVSAFDEQRKFTGQEYDTATNLHYYGQRYYNQDVGRFTSQDPVHLLIGDSERFKETAQRTLEFHLSNPQSLNSYSYTINNPLKYVDETGEIWWIIAALFYPEVAYAPATPEETYNDPTGKALFIGSFAPIGGGAVKSVSGVVKNLADDAAKLTKFEREVVSHGYEKHAVQQAEWGTPPITQTEYVQKVQDIQGNYDVKAGLQKTGQDGRVTGKTYYGNMQTNEILIKNTTGPSTFFKPHSPVIEFLKKAIPDDIRTYGWNTK